MPRISVAKNSVEERIICNKCQKEKHPTYFLVEEIKSINPVCKDCSDYTAWGSWKRQGKQVERSMKICKRCDKEFTSLNGYITCPKCRKRARKYL